MELPWLPFLAARVWQPDHSFKSRHFCHLHSERLAVISSYWVVARAFNPSTQETSQVNLCEFEAWSTE